ncbi:MAG: htpX [Acidimicrobiales bacterium]|nr:htpX [Acidimicrobiales bacterium]
MAGFVLIIVAVAWAVGLLLGFGVAGLVIAVVIAGAAAFVSYWKSDAVALRMSHGRPADPERYARLHNVVEGLCIAAGLPKPRVYVIEDPAPNAFATGRNPRHAAVAVTTGLLDTMNRIELEGVLAHELSHIKNYDVLVSTLAVTLVGMVAPPLMQFAVSRRREGLADVSGVSLTRYPPGLISALEKLKADKTVVHFNSRATAHLWIESPLPNRLFDTHPPLDERIKVLKEL